MATKAELENENKKLRSKIKELLSVAKKQEQEAQSVSAENLPHLALGVVKTEKGFEVVRVRFDLETGVAGVVGHELAAPNYPKDPIMSEQFFLNVLHKEVIDEELVLK